MHVDCGPYRIIDKRTRAKDKESLEEAQTLYGRHLFKIKHLIFTSCFKRRKIQYTMSVPYLSGTVLHENHKKELGFACIALEDMTCIVPFVHYFLFVEPIDFLFLF